MIGIVQSKALDHLIRGERARHARKKIARSVVFARRDASPRLDGVEDPLDGIGPAQQRARSPARLTLHFSVGSMRPSRHPLQGRRRSGPIAESGDQPLLRHFVRENNASTLRSTACRARRSSPASALAIPLRLAAAAGRAASSSGERTSIM